MFTNKFKQNSADSVKFSEIDIPVLFRSVIQHYPITSFFNRGEVRFWTRISALFWLYLDVNNLPNAWRMKGLYAVLIFVDFCVEFVDLRTPRTNLATVARRGCGWLSSLMQNLPFWLGNFAKQKKLKFIELFDTSDLDKQHN